MKKIYAAVVLLLTMAACTGSMMNKPLEGTKWKLSEMKGIPATAISAEADNFTLLFNAADTMLSGRTNCNRFFGKYEVDGREIDFKDMGMTRMACPDMQYEDLFVKMLDQADRFMIKGSELTLLEDQKILAVFMAEEPAAQK